MSEAPSDASATALALRFTYFHRVTQTAGRSYTRTLEQIARWWATPPAHHGGKRELPVWCAATFSGNRRTGANVETVTAIVLDFDGVAMPLAAAAGKLPVACLGHTSWSHGSPDKPGNCFRLLVPVNRALTLEQHALVWAQFAAFFGILGAEVDAKTRDPGRAWFVPCSSGRTYESIAELARPVFDVGQALIHTPPAARPATLSGARQEGRSPPPSSGSSWRAGRPSVLERARRYLETKEPSISGSGGHQALYRAALDLVRGFDLPAPAALELLAETFNPRCVPPWPLADLQRKVREADKAERAGRGYLLTERSNNR